MLGTLSMKFTGTLTAGRTITIPAKTKLLMVENATTGGFTLSSENAFRHTYFLWELANVNLLYCDGTTFQIVAETAVGATIPLRYWRDAGGRSYGRRGRIALSDTARSAVSRRLWPTAVAFAGTASGATATFSIRKNGTQFATMQFAAGVSTPTFTAATAHRFCSRRRVDHHCALAQQTARLADIGFALAGIRL
jgi:hypothetical protein